MWEGAKFNDAVGEELDPACETLRAGMEREGYGEHGG